MNEHELRTLLSDFTSGKIDINDTISNIKSSLFRTTELGYATPDHHRELRHGLNEVIYGEGKSIEQIINIATHLAQSNRCVLITRLNDEKINALDESFAGHINRQARTFMLNPPSTHDIKIEKRFVAVMTAGTSDITVAEEAAEVCFAMKIPVKRIYDVGVAGLHRVISTLDVVQKATVTIVVAGMEGALPSVIGGLINAPIIAVPTSVGYGASLHGLAALLGMLNSCSPGVLVTNIDAGFSAGFAACRIMNRIISHENTLS